MSIMFLEGTYPSPGEVHEGRLQLVEVSLHTQVCTDLGPQMLLEGQDWHVDSRASCFELSVLGAAYCSRTGCEEPGQRGDIPAAGLDVPVPVLPASKFKSSPTRVTSGTRRRTTPCLERSS